MKFDYVIGNPPFQESNESNNRQPPIYPAFYDSSEEIADKYILISPARFLFNAGLTPKPWNKKMLSDEHLKVEMYEQNGSSVFPNTDIKGGVAIVYRDKDKNFGAIGSFIPDKNLREIVKHLPKDSESLSKIMHGGRSDLKFNDEFLKEYPKSTEDRLLAIQEKHPNVKKLSVGEEYELKSPTLDVLDYAFSDEDPKDTENYYHILGLSNKKRVYRWINRKFMTPRNKDNNIEAYKVLMPKAFGNGKFGEALGELVIQGPGESFTPTFISIGCFKTRSECVNVCKYVKTKFARALVGILKITQDNVPGKWKYVPLQDFTDNSDIDWSKSIHEIDEQLYNKYNLSADERNFIETNVKEMA